MSKKIVILVAIMIVLVLSLVVVGLRFGRSNFLSGGKYSWKTESIPGCSTSKCYETGSQSKKVFCIDEYGETVDDGACSEKKPDTTQPCFVNDPTCPQWMLNGNVDNYCGIGSDIKKYVCSTGKDSDCNQQPYSPENISGKHGDTIVVRNSSLCRYVKLNFSGFSSSTPFGKGAKNESIELIDNSIIIQPNSINGCFMICIVWHGEYNTNIDFSSLTNSSNVSTALYYNDSTNVIHNRGIGNTLCVIYKFNVNDPSVRTVFQIDKSLALKLPEALAKESAGELFMFQINKSIIYPLANPPVNLDFPKLMTYVPYLQNPSNNSPFNGRDASNGIVELNTPITNNSITINYSSTTSSGEFLLLIMWSGDMSNSFRTPTITVSGGLRFKQTFNDNTSSFVSAVGYYNLIYMSILEYSGTGTGTGTVTFGNNGNIPNKTGRIYIVKIL